MLLQCHDLRICFQQNPFLARGSTEERFAYCFNNFEGKLPSLGLNIFVHIIYDLLFPNGCDIDALFKCIYHSFLLLYFLDQMKHFLLLKEEFTLQLSDAGLQLFISVQQLLYFCPHLIRGLLSLIPTSFDCPSSLPSLFHMKYSLLITLQFFPRFLQFKIGSRQSLTHLFDLFSILNWSRHCPYSFYQRASEGRTKGFARVWSLKMYPFTFMWISRRVKSREVSIRGAALRYTAISCKSSASG